MEKSEFSCHIVENYNGNELAQILVKDPYCNFYELCQKYLDLALNAIPVKSENGEIFRHFQDVDVNLVKTTVLDFFHQHDIRDFEKFFEITKQVYNLSIASNEKRKTAGSILVKALYTEEFGSCGEFGAFNVIPDEVFDKLEIEIMQEVNTKSV